MVLGMNFLSKIIIFCVHQHISPGLSFSSEKGLVIGNLDPPRLHWSQEMLAVHVCMSPFCMAILWDILDLPQKASIQDHNTSNQQSQSVRMHM